VEEGFSSFVILRYSGMSLAAMLALRSAYRLMRNGINHEAYVNALDALRAKGEFTRLAKLTAAAGSAPAATMIARGFSLRLPTVGAPSGDGEHFRDGGAQGAPFAVAFEREMNAAQTALTRQVRADGALAVLGCLIVDLLAIVGLLFSSNSGSTSRNATALAIAALFAAWTHHTAKGSVAGIVAARAFCDRHCVAAEDMNEERMEAAKLLEGVWRRQGPRAAGERIDA
jgi:hypothetical protein